MKANGRKKALALVGAIAAATALAAPSVEISNVQQQYPWTNTVDITYTVQGVSKTHQTNRLDHIVNDTYFATFEAKNGNTAIQDVNGNTVFTNGLVQGNGTFTAQWNPKTDLQLTGCTMTPSVFRGEENAYLVVNLETNAQGKMEWWYEPMSTQEASNERYNTELYKTKYMVFRRIPKGVHTIGKAYYGSAAISPNNIDINITNDYYMGVFPATTAQYGYIMNSSDSRSSKVPKAFMSYIDLRGGASAGVPVGNGVLKTMSDRTGLSFDLPTCAMSFVARSAGITTTWISPTSGTITEYGWVQSNSAVNGTRKSHDVGLKKPNNWGLYDVVGNVWETTRDVYNSNMTKVLAWLQNGLTPITEATNGNIMEVSGCFENPVGHEYLRLFEAWPIGNNQATVLHGFRVSVIISAP